MTHHDPLPLREGRLTTSTTYYPLHTCGLRGVEPVLSTDYCTPRPSQRPSTVRLDERSYDTREAVHTEACDYHLHPFKQYGAIGSTGAAVGHTVKGGRGIRRRSPRPRSPRRRSLRRSLRRRSPRSGSPRRRRPRRSSYGTLVRL